MYKRCDKCHNDKSILDFCRLKRNGDKINYKNCSSCRDICGKYALRSYHKNKGLTRPRIPFDEPIDKSPKDPIKLLSCVKVYDFNDYKTLQAVEEIFNKNSIDTIDKAKGIFYHWLKKFDEIKKEVIKEVDNNQ